MRTNERTEKVKVTCPCCAEVARISTRHEGYRLRCPHCKAKVRFTGRQLLDLEAERRKRRQDYKAREQKQAAKQTSDRKSVV